jgi:hypothetical protein
MRLLFAVGKCFFSSLSLCKFLSVLSLGLLKAKFCLSFFDRQNLLGLEGAQHQSSSRLIKGFLSLFSSFLKLL